MEEHLIHLSAMDTYFQRHEYNEDTEERLKRVIFKYFRTRLFNVKFNQELKKLAEKYRFVPDEHQTTREDRITEHSDFLRMFAEWFTRKNEKLQNDLVLCINRKARLEEMTYYAFDIRYTPEFRGMPEEIRLLENKIKDSKPLMFEAESCYINMFIAPSDKPAYLQRQSEANDQMSQVNSQPEQSVGESIPVVEDRTVVKSQEQVDHLVEQMIGTLKANEVYDDEPEETILDIIIGSLKNNRSAEVHDDTVSSTKIEVVEKSSTSPEDRDVSIGTEDLQAHMTDLIGDKKTRGNGLKKLSETVSNEHCQSNPSLQAASMEQLNNHVHQPTIEDYSQQEKAVAEPMLVGKDQPSSEPDQKMNKHVSVNVVEQVIGDKKANGVERDEQQDINDDTFSSKEMDMDVSNEIVDRRSNKSEEEYAPKYSSLLKRSATEQSSYTANKKARNMDKNEIDKNIVPLKEYVPRDQAVSPSEKAVEE